MRTILVTGGAGHLARIIASTPPRDATIIERTHRQLDITDAHQIHAAIERWHPAAIINAANRVHVLGQPAVDFARTNYLGPAILADVTRLHGVRLVQPIRPYRPMGGMMAWPHVRTVLVDMMGQPIEASARALLRAAMEE